MFKNTPYELSLMEPLPLLKIHRYILHTSHKKKLRYCIYNIDKKGKFLEDICIATGLEVLHNLNLNERHQSTKYIWL